MNRLALLAAIALAAGCFVDQGGVTASGAATGTGESTTTTTTTTTTSSTTTTTTTTTTSSTSGDSTTTGAISTTLETTTSGDSTTTGDSTTGDSTTTTAGPAEEILTHLDDSKCSKWIWCYSNFPANGVPARIWAQECYSSSLPGPLAIADVRYKIAMTLGDVTQNAPALEIYSRTATGPGALLTSRPLTSADLSPGDHQVALDPPLIVDSPEFCVGLLVGPEVLGPYVSVAIGAEGTPDAGESYVKMTGQGGCNIASFSDVLEKTVTPGNWCIGARVIESP